MRTISRPRGEYRVWCCYGCMQKKLQTYVRYR